MDASTFETAEPFVEKIAEKIDEAFDGPHLTQISGLLAELSKSLGSLYAVNLTIRLEVFEREKHMTIALASTGLTTSDGSEPYRTWEEDTIQRYIVDGGVQMVPHDRCPKCWHTWDFKFHDKTCQHCGAKLGQDVKLVLDSVVCPNCEMGKISAAAPTCDKCGFEVDSDLVVWGQ